MVLVGNKSDLSNKREVNTEIEQKFDKYGMLFYEASAKNGINADKIFQNSEDKIAQDIDQGYYDLENDSCGIKQGVNRPRGNNNRQQIIYDNNNKKKKSGGYC